MHTIYASRQYIVIQYDFQNQKRILIISKSKVKDILSELICIQLPHYIIIFPFLSNEPNSYTNIFINWIILCNRRLNKSIKYSILKQINNPVFIFDFVSKDQKDNDCTKPLPSMNLLGFNQAFGTRNIYLNSLSAIDYSMNILNFFVVFCTTWTGSLSCTWQLGDSCYNLVTDHQSFFAAQAQCQLVYNGNLVRIPKFN